MLETIFTFYILYLTNVNKMPACMPYVQIEGQLDACYNPSLRAQDGKIIILVNEKTSRPKDFVVYHELGHALFPLYDHSLFKNKEVMADQFALYIFLHKNPSFKIYETQRRYDYFEFYCPETCVSDILKLKVPGSKPWYKTFEIRT